MDDEIGRYRLEESLGQGATGEVFRAFDPERRRPVAVKVFSAAVSADAALVERIDHDTRVVARLTDPHVISVHEVGTIDGTLYVDMRLVNGVDLDTLVATSGPLPPTRAVAVVGQIAGALDAAHAEGVLHRSVKPSNVLLSGAGTDFVHVVDFATAPPLAAGRSTIPGTSTGTLGYTAPEQLAGAPVDGRADVYSLACVLHKLLTGRRPFDVDGTTAMVAAHHSAPPPRPSAQPGVPAALDEVISRGMAKDPAYRFGSAGALAAAAYAALHSPATSSAPTGVMAVPAPPTHVVAPRTEVMSSTRPTEVVQAPPTEIVSAPPAYVAPTYPAGEQTAFVAQPPAGRPPGAVAPLPEPGRSRRWLWGVITALVVVAVVVGIVVVVVNRGGGTASTQAAAPTTASAATPTPAPASASPLPSNAFIDGNRRFAFVPPPGWVRDDTGTRAAVLYFRAPEPTTSASGQQFSSNINTAVVGASGDLDSLVTTVVGNDRSSFQDYQQTLDQQTTLPDGTPARLIGATGLTSTGTKLQILELYAVHGQYAYVMTGTSLAEAWGDAGPLITASLKTVRVVL